MPDYNLGRAHGTIKVDYDGRGVHQADEDLSKLGRTSEETGRKTEASAKKTSADYDALGAAARRLEQEVARAAAAEIAARARAAAAQEHLAQVQKDTSSSARDLIDAQRNANVELKRYEDVTIKARTSTKALADVRRELAGQHRPDVTPNADLSKFEEITRHLKNIDKSTRSSSSVLNTFRSRLLLIVAASALAAPSLSSLAQALIALTGLIGPAAAGLAALGAVGGTLATAFSGMGAIFKAAGQQAASAGSDAAQSASQQRAAAREIQQAIRGVRDAEENLQNVQRTAAQAAVQAAQQIIQAERTLRDAQFDALRAQEDLTRARRDATRQLEDLRSALTGGALDERQAVIDVQRAQEELNKTLADPRSSDLDRQQAILNLEKQKQALDDVSTRNQRLGQDQADAAAKGVEGSSAVVDAQQQVVHSQEAVEAAALGVADAVVAAAQQQIDSQRDVRNAIEGIADAQVALQEAYLSAAETAASSGAKMADALANVSPEARSLAQAILGQRDAWQEVKFAVQDALFANLSKEVAPLANQWLPLLKSGMVGIATELHGLILDLIDFLHQGRTTADVTTIFDNTKQAVHNIIPAVRALLSVFLDLATVGSSFLPGLAKGFAEWAQHLADVSRNARDAGTMQQWMQTALATAGKLWDLFKNIASIIGTIFSAFSAEGGDTLSTLTELTRRLDEFLKSAAGQQVLHALGSILAALAHLFGDALLGALKAVGPAFVVLAPVIKQIIDLVAVQLVTGLKIVGPLLTGLAVVFSALGPILVPLIASIVSLNIAVKVASIVWGILNNTMKGNPFIAIIAIVIALATLIITNWDAIKTALLVAWDTIQQAASAIWGAIKAAIVTPILEIIDLMVVRWKNFISDIVNLWNGFLGAVKVAWDHIRSAIVDPIADAISNVLQFFRDLPGDVAVFFSDAAHWLFDAGKNIIQGLINGLRNAASAVFRFFKDMIGDAIDGVLSIFGISSPSKVFEDIGQWTWEGYLVGITDMKDPVVTRMIEISAAATNAGTPEQQVPAASVPSPRTPPDAGTPENAASRPIAIQTLNLTVTGNLDPTDKVQWRKAIKNIKKDIEGVERSEQP
jgi:hypothetical protein